MYRQKARAAHKLQQQYPPLSQQQYPPVSNQQQQLPPDGNQQQQLPPDGNQQQQLPSGGNQQQQLSPAGNQQFSPVDPQQQQLGAWNGQQEQQQSPGGSGVLMFNPSQYQNGVVDAPPVIPVQPESSQQPVQQQADHQQWNGDAQYGGAGGWDQRMGNNQKQDVNQNVPEAQWQGYNQRQERSESVLSDAGSSVSQHQQFQQQQQYAGYQQQQEYRQSVHQQFSNQEQQQEQNTDQYKQQASDQFPTVPQNLHPNVNQYPQLAVDNQHQQQNADQYQQQINSQQSTEAQNQQQTVDSQNSKQRSSIVETSLPLILDDSGQWYWNYKLQQWQPYYGGDGSYPRDQQQNAASEAITETVAQNVVQGVEDGGGVSMFYNNDVMEDIGQITNQISQLTVAVREMEPEKEKGSRRNSQMSADSHKQGIRQDSQMSADSQGQMRTRQDSHMSSDIHGQARIRQDSLMPSDSYTQGHQISTQAQYAENHMQSGQRMQGSGQFGDSNCSGNFGDNYGPGQFSNRKVSSNFGDSQFGSEQLGNAYNNVLISESGAPGPAGDSPVKRDTLTPSLSQQQYVPLIEFSPNSRQNTSINQLQDNPPLMQTQSGESCVDNSSEEIHSNPPTSNQVPLASALLQSSVGFEPEKSVRETHHAPLPMFQTPPISQEQPPPSLHEQPPPSLHEQPPSSQDQHPPPQHPQPQLYQQPLPQHHQPPPQQQPPIQYQPPTQQQASPLQHQQLITPIHQPEQPPPLPQQQPVQPTSHQELPSHQLSQHSGPPDVVDHRPNTSQPEIVSDLDWSVTSSSQDSPAHQAHPDLHPQSLQPNQWRHGPALPASQAPDITAHPVSSPSVIAGHPAPPTSQPAVSHDQHYDYYKMPDVTAGRATPPQPLPAPPKAPDILRTAEPVMPSSDRNLFMETGELTEEDAVRVHPPPMSVPAQLPPMVGAPPAAAILHPPAHLPPMVGGNDPPSVSRMVLGDALQPEFPATDSQLRLVEGESVPNLSPLTQPSFDRSVEGESVGAPPSIGSLPNRQVEGGSITSSPTIPPNARRVDGESIAPPPSMAPPTLRRVEGEAGPSLPPPTLPQGGREVEVEGEPGPPTAPPINPPPLMDQRIVTGLANQSSTAQPPAVKVEVNSPSSFHPATSAFHPPPSSQYHSQPYHRPPPTNEARSETVGSDRRDETVMGGPIGAKATPLPTPGRDVAGSEGGVEERSHENGREKAVNKPRDRNYDSDDDTSFRDRDSGDSDRDPRYQSSRQRRTISPDTNRRYKSRVDRYNRSSTERDEDSDRRYKQDYDRREHRRKHDHERNMRREHDRRYNYDPDRKGNRYVRERYRRDDADRYRRDDDERSFRGASVSVKDEPLDRSYIRSFKRESDFDRNSVFEEDYRRPSRPSSRTGSVSHFEPRDQMEMMYTLQQQQAAMYQQQMAMMNPQYQQQVLLQEAIQKMEKALEDPANVKIYKQHWDYYQMQPKAFEKLKLENPMQHHLLSHFAKKFLHLVEEKKDQNDNNNVNKEERKFSEECHRAESRQAQELSTIYNENSEGNFVDSVIGDTRSDDNLLPDRLTPVMFSRPHVCARIAPTGLLVKVDAACPQDGQSATIELHHMSALFRHLPESSEFTSFPGPLVPGETHKNDVIKFCERKVHSARDRSSMTDRDSYILLWEMLILLLRQNGQVEGSDIADLLLKDYTDQSSLSYANGKRGGSHAGSVKDASIRYEGHRDETTSSASSVHNEESNDTVVVYSKTSINTTPTEDVTSRFRDYLLHGNKHEGLEYAMKEGLWGHALFLASKMDQRTYAGVMTRFANGLALNDPLQTLYQLMSSRQPTAMKQCADQRWGDWRPHLAMILSNQVAGNLNQQSMVTLGDTLGSKGQLHAAQFCYIVSSCEFGTFTKKKSKLVLLCSTMSDFTLEEFATNEAIQCTEIYEFVQKLGNREFEMATLQVYKFLYAIRLLDNGLPGLAQHYCKIIADFIVRNPTRVETDFLPDFIFQLESLAERLKYQDPVYTTSIGEMNEISDPEWLVKFRETVETYFRGGNIVNTSQTGTWAGSYDEEYSNQEYQSYDQHYQQQDDTQQTNDQQVYNHYDQGLAPSSLNDENRSDSTNQQKPNMYDPNRQETTNEVYDSGNQTYKPGNQPYDLATQMYDPAAYNQPDPTQRYDPAGYNQPDPTQRYDPAGYNQPDPSQHSQEPTASENTDATNNVTEATEQPTQPVMFDPSLYNQNFYNPNDFNNPPIHEESQASEPVRRPSLAEMTRQRSRTTSQVDSGTPTTPTSSSPPNFSLYEGISTKPPALQPPSVDQPQPPLPTPAKIEKEKKKEPEKTSQTTSWVGGLFGKLFKGGNQVHLPDDTNKKILFDEKLGRWVNTEGEEDDLAPAAPPPMDSAFTGSKSRPGPTPAGPGGYSMSGAAGKRRGRGYVDVFAKAGATTPAVAPPNMLLNPTAAPSGLAPTPAILNPVAGMPLDPANMPTSFPTAEGSSSQVAAPENGPTFFNPSSMAGITGPPAF